MTAKELINIDPELMGGTPVFRGTRVPVKTLFDHIQEGDSIEIFLDDFPTVSREQTMTFLETAMNTMISEAEA